MRCRLWFVLGLLIALAAVSFAQGWEWLNPLPQGNAIVGMAVPSGDTLRFFGPRGLVLERIGGEWIVRHGHDSLAYMRSYSFVDANRGWGVQESWDMNGTHARLLRTVDGGHSWHEQVVADGLRAEFAFFLDAQHGWVAGYHEQTYADMLARTTDGGQSWTTNAVENLYCSFSGLDFLNANEGWALTECAVLHTQNGGVTWERWNYTGYVLTHPLQMQDSQTGWAMGRATATGNDLYQTTNGGRTWTREGLSLYGYNRVHDIALPAPGQVWAVADSGLIYHSTNSGGSWTRFPSFAGAQLASIRFTNAGAGYVTGTGGLVLHTANGTQWNVIAGNLETQHQSIAVLDFVDPQTGWLLDTLLRRTTDGGLTWSPCVMPAREVWDISALDATHAWAAGEALLHTTDGLNWEEVPTGWPHDLEAVQALSENHVWLVGEENYLRHVVLRTSDGGQSWQQSPPINVGKSAELFAVDPFNAWLGGWVSDSWGYVLHTEDGGQTWVRQGGEHFPCVDDVFFIDEHTGWLAASGDTLLYRTTNGGATWTGVDIPGFRYGGVDHLLFIDAQHGWLECRGRHYATTDGGLTWSSTNLDVESYWSTYDFVDETHGWAGGTYGTLLRYVDQSGDVPEPNAVPLPMAWTLAAYPNPFNPATKLTFTLPTRGPVTLKVYDLLGREVAVLADAVFAAGNHTITFDGADLTSGIYFARLESSGLSATHKLVLLK